MALQEQFCKLNGLTIRYYDGGALNYRTVLLLHSEYGDARMNWESILPDLTEKYYTIAPDLPGYGGSDPLEMHSLDAVADWVAQFLNSLEVKQAVVVGVSWGALVARLLAARYPEVVTALVVASGGALPAQGCVRMVADLPIIGGRIFGQMAGSALTPVALRVLVHDKKCLTDAMIAQIQEERLGMVHTLKLLTLSPTPEKRRTAAPALVLWGENDTLTPPELGKQVQSLLPGAELTWIAKCGHLPHLEEPDIFMHQLGDYLRRLENRK